MQLGLPARAGSGLQLLNTVVTCAQEGNIRGKLRARPSVRRRAGRQAARRRGGLRVGHRPIR